MRFCKFTLLLAPTLLQAQSSLFFTQDEITIIEGNVKEKITPKLFGILYINEENWTIWINNQCMRSRDLIQTSEFKIQKVTSDTVTLQWGDSPRSIILKPECRKEVQQFERKYNY